jgi:hypothetical protein
VADTATHVTFTVRVAEHEQGDPERTAWRVRHAAGTFAIVGAWFATGEDGKPDQDAGGTFEIHAPSRTTLDTLRQMITDHEGMIIVSEDEAPGLGIIYRSTPA